MNKKKVVKIINATNGHFLAKIAVYADSFFSRLVGLLGKKSLEEGEGLVLKPCNMVHTIGMRFDIDVLFLSEANEILYIINEMKPQKISPLIKKSVLVVELPAGTIQKTNTQIGDEIELLVENKPA
ncbi:hypothetical protein SYNTR_1510 [Candidatus Syntrophocurvum alkaliphilum]|uniref:DUF192 domain-containing protein n=1 Tax=Candidatus Syntrophocurvum alkaliphilum TaxID=2293317 RepID=A0A6I6DIX6_9FIRM|nr:DUF192 domain-containing protein [Candidatus Syntrophocurvum alkaliphilum]QGU00104.1 hypothetical protein SYNTR_1510 [Candidatus Syntrophocurvum alkaliphilum]